MSSAQPFRNPLVVALDVDDLAQALSLADQLGALVGGFKLGPRLCLRYGMSLVKEIAARGPVFMDNKHFDIASTMLSSVLASFEAGSSVVTVHGLSGREALRNLAILEKELNQVRPFRILAVTILTSWDFASLPANFHKKPIADHVTDIVNLVTSTGLKGVVCSPEELPLFKDKGLFLVTPGIRFSTDEKGDQVRTAGPAEALQAGARVIVVGRPIIQDADPVEATHRFLKACGLETA